MLYSFPLALSIALALLPNTLYGHRGIPRRLNSAAWRARALVTRQDAAAPAAAAGNADLTVLQFALTLENLESEFYSQASKTLDTNAFEKAGFGTNQAKSITQQIAQQLVDEQTHVKILSDTITSLGATPFSGCQFNFDAALTDPVTFLSVARTVEATGVGAYIGGAGLLSNKAILTAAAQILPIEARHQTVLNLFSGGSAVPQSFDIGLTPPQVLALAGGFLKNCTPNDLGLTANPPLSVVDSLTDSTFFTTGSVLNFQTSANVDSQQASNLSCQMLVGGAASALVFPANSCVVPPKINGPVAVFLTKDNTPLDGSVATQKADSIVAGPALIFVDINDKEDLQKSFQLKNLNVKSLPSANLGFAGLAAQDGNSNNAGADKASSTAQSKFRARGMHKSYSNTAFHLRARALVQWG